jgi:Fic family protein
VPSFVKRHWRADLEAFGGRRSRRGFIYRAFVPDEIADLELAIPADVAEAAAAAAAAIGALRPEPDGISWEALGRQLLRSESVASSRIEGLEISHRRLARASFGRAHRDLTADSVLGNIAAMETAIARGAAKQIGPADILAIHETLFRSTPDSHIGGRFRTSQGWIGGGSTPANADFVPPPEDLVASLVKDLCEFASRDDLPAVIQAAIVHAQFETIHPFPDGNGRVGRCLVHAVLGRRGLSAGLTLPISLALGANSKAYIRGLVAFRAGRVAEWCGLFAAATRTAAEEVEGLRGIVRNLQARWLELAGSPRPDSAATGLVLALPGHPIVDVAAVETIAGVSNQAARLAVLALEKAGVLRRINTGKRNRAWEAVGLFEHVDAFERRLRARASP